MAKKMSMAQRIAVLGPGYRARWRTAKVDLARVAEVDRVVSGMLLANRARYEAVVAGTRIPWWMIGVTHYRESTCNFRTHPHNGDPLKARTVQKPAGRPASGLPPFTWEESARDCYLVVKRWQDVPVWDLATVHAYLEAFNGWGYEDYHGEEESPYLYAGTNHHDETGKYVKDGRYDAKAPERQLGVVALMLGLQKAGVNLGMEPAKADPSGLTGPEIKGLQEALAAKGYSEVGTPNEVMGSRTAAAITAFQVENGLPVTGTFDEATRRAIPEAPHRPIAEGRATATVDDLRAAGSETVKSADGIGTMGKWIAGGGVLAGAKEGADATGAIDKVTEAVGQAQQVRTIVESVGDLVRVAAPYWWVLALAAGAYLIWKARGVMLRRLADHRSGANTGR